MTDSVFIKGGAIAQELLEGLGMERNQFIVVLHNDAEFEGKPRPHAHIIANRVNIDGQCVDSWRDFHRAKEVIRTLEEKYGHSHGQNPGL